MRAGCFQVGIAATLALLVSSGAARATTVAFWQFEEGAIGTAAPTTSGAIVDSSANHINATAVGGPVYQASLTQSGSKGLLFDGVNDRIAIPDDPRLALTGSLTLEAIVRIDGYSASSADFNQIVFRGDNRGGFDPYFLAIRPSTGRLFFHIADAANNPAAISSSWALPLHEWLHVAGTLDDATGTMRLFVNGQQVASATTGLRPFATLTGVSPGLGIGNVQSGGNTQYFDGMIARGAHLRCGPGGGGFPGHPRARRAVGHGVDYGGGGGAAAATAVMRKHHLCNHL
jgi:hypothetical protein